MARTKNPKVSPRAAATPVMDPWDVEFQQSLATHGPVASTNHIYPSAVHRGFEAQDVAEPLARRYPIFEETEAHREFLVRSRSNRLVTTGESYNYYTPEELWEEDDRLRGMTQFARSGELSWVDEEEDSSDEEGPIFQKVVVQEQPKAESEDGLELPLEPISFPATDARTSAATYHRLRSCRAG